MNVIVFGTGSSLQHEIEEEFRANGHEVTSSLSRTKIPNRFYDVAVDTSARGMSDMRLVVQALKDKTSHYILISSYKVYPSIPRVIPWHTGDIDLCDESGVEALNRTVREYRAVERELQMHFPLSMEWTILRPAIVEEKENPEPNNMSWFVNRILDGGPIVFPDNDDLLFRHISSNDLARAVCLMAKREEVFSQMIHLASNALLSFESYARMLMKCLGQEVPA